MIKREVMQNCIDDILLSTNSKDAHRNGKQLKMMVDALFDDLSTAASIANQASEVNKILHDELRMAAHNYERHTK